MIAGRMTRNGAGLAALALVASVSPGHAQSLVDTSVYLFTGYTGVGPNDGSSPVGGTLVDRNNPAYIYGTTAAGGQFNAGSVYVVEGKPGEPLYEHAIYSFKADPDLGAPTGRLYQDASGALYGGAIAGGTYRNGGLFKLTPPPSGTGPGNETWTETVLHSFPGRSALGPNFNVSGLVADARGSLYGTVFAGRGEVFQYTPAGHYHVIHAFSGRDGQGPSSPITIGPDGVLYGVTSYGGSNPCGGYGCGTVYALTPPASGDDFAFATVYSFDGSLRGQEPYGPVALAPDGSIFGTNYTHGNTEQAGTLGGTVFRIHRPAGAAARASLVYMFAGQAKPFNGVRFDSAGGIYGTYIGGDSHQHEYTLAPDAPGSYTYSTLTDLYARVSAGIATDGVTLTQASPTSDVVLDDVDEEGAPEAKDVNGFVYRLRIRPAAGATASATP